MPSIRKKFYILFTALIAVSFLVVFLDRQFISKAKAGQDEGFDWRSEWAVDEGFSLQQDSSGYHFPTGIAFVTHPGPGPRDPLYFVTELRGKVKVVTNDRTIYTFAENFFNRKPAKELPEIEGQTGLAGICLAPEEGYVFATFAYLDRGDVLRNNIVRFDTRPTTFSIKPASQKTFTRIFQDYESVVSHQIGSCQVADHSLYVSVGDGRQPGLSQVVDSPLGKVLHMTLDGSPAAGNPFYHAETPEKVANYVWAMGFRNPFGLSAVGSRLFVADNGSQLDRFVEVERGENYLWDGTDWSIGSRASVALSPNVGPVQVDYYPGGLPALPDKFGQNFFVATSRPDMSGVIRIPYSSENKRLSSAPAFFVKHVGDRYQIVAGVAVGPDGLYFAPVMPDQAGESAILKITYQPDQQSPYLLSKLKDPESIMWMKGCLGCHQKGGNGGNVGPALDYQPLVERLKARLNSPEYSQTLSDVDRLNKEPFTSYHNARLAVSQAKNDQKLRLWMIYHIMEPKFDNPYAQMPNLGLSKTDATIVTDYLLKEPGLTERAKDLVMPYMPEVIMPRHLIMAFGAGLLAGALLLALAFMLRRWFKSRTPRQPGD